MRFENKVAIVTGSGNGIGKEIAKRLAKEGASVVITDMNRADCQRTKEDIMQRGGKALAIPADVSEKEEVMYIVREARKTFGEIDILVNNAGSVKGSKITGMTEEEWNHIVDTCLKGSSLFPKYTAEHMVEQSYGKIVNIASHAYLGNPGQVSYSSVNVANTVLFFAINESSHISGDVLHVTGGRFG